MKELLTSNLVLKLVVIMLYFCSMDSLGCTTGQSLFSLHAGLTQKVSAGLGEVQ